MDGKIYVVGIGPGDMKSMSVKAIDAIKESGVVIGYQTYLDLISGLYQGKTVVSSGMRKEVERCHRALEYAETGKTVSLISSGDAGVYGMAGLMLEVKSEKKSNVEVEVIPGISAVFSCAALLGAPLMNDFAVISLSDLLTDRKDIINRIICAAKGDFVIALYNPKSAGRQTLIRDAKSIIMRFRKPETPVGIVAQCERDGENTIITTLDKMLENTIDMTTTVIIGNSKTKLIGDKMITPRGYVL